MTEMRYDELRSRAGGEAEAAFIDHVRKAEARSHIFSELEKMKDEGKAITLSDEEMQMLSAFRRFKLRMRRDGEVFTWQTRKPEGIEVVGDSGLIVHPNEQR